MDVAYEAGALSLEWLKRGAKSWDKSPGSPVTEADIALNNLIQASLMTARPDYGWLSEETEDDPGSRNAPHTWVIDPIDGTRGFMKGLPTYTVCIARVDGTEPIAAAVYNPLAKQMFAAGKGLGATLNGEPISVTDRALVEDCLMIGLADKFHSKAASKVWPRLRLLDPMPNSIAYRICLVAAGQADASLSTGRLHDWDIAAAALILSEAGGIITDQHGASYRLNGEEVCQTGMVAAGANLHPLVLENLRQMARPS